MKILKATHLGMCFGVRDAIALARQAAQRQPVTVFGQLVHNPVVLRDLARHGIRMADTPEEIGTDTVLISAHGASERARTRLAGRTARVLETTCPLVHRAHQALAELVADGCHPIVIGKPGHVEVRGLTEDLPACDIVLTDADVDALQERPRYGVVAQTTQPVDRVLRLVERLRRRFPRSEVHFRDTVCRPTRDRQQAAIDLARRCTVVVVIGGANSNNTRELTTTCRRFCRRVHQVESPRDLAPHWFHVNDVVGLTAGTSTPDGVIDRVEQLLHRWADRKHATVAPRRKEPAHVVLESV